MPSFSFMLVFSSQNSFWDITLCVPQGNCVILVVRYYYYYSLSIDVEMEAQGDLQTCPRLHNQEATKSGLESIS